MASRKTRVVLAADLKTTSEISHALSQAGPSICMLKTHVDGVVDFEYTRWMDEIVRPAREMGILIFEDRKFPVLHPGTEHFLDINTWRSDGEMVPELVLESGIV